MEAGLVEVGVRVRFRHPLARSAVARAAEVTDLQTVHLALAEATDPNLDPDRRAWHRAHAAAGPDEVVAIDLESSADRARARGGLAAQAAFLERAIELTNDPARRPARILAAARARHQAGSSEAALTLLAELEAASLDERTRAELEVLRAQIAFFSSHSRDAPPLLLSAARRMEALDGTAARDIYLDALAAGLLVGRLSGDVGARDVAVAARSAPPSIARPADLLLDGMALLMTDGHAEGVPPLRRALSAWRTDEVPIGDALRWLWLATHAAHDVWDDESWEVLCTRHLRLARQAGALAVLPIALSTRMGLHFFAGELADAAALVDEFQTVNEVMDNHLLPYGAMALAAWRGRQDVASELIRTTFAGAAERGEGMGLTIVDYSSAVLHNSLGSVPGSPGGGGAGSRVPARARLRHVVPGGTRRGRDAKRPPRPRRGCTRAAGPDHERQRHRMGPGDRSPISRTGGQGDAAEASTSRPSSGSAGPACASSSPAPTCCTASGCGASTAVSMPAAS